MVNIDQQHNLLRQNQKAGKVLISVTFWCGCVTTAEVKK